MPEPRRDHPHEQRDHQEREQPAHQRIGPRRAGRSRPATVEGVPARPTSHCTRLISSRPPRTTMPISQSEASCGLPPSRTTRRSSGRSTGSLALRTNRGQAPNGLIRRLRTAQAVARHEGGVRERGNHEDPGRELDGGGDHGGAAGDRYRRTADPDRTLGARARGAHEGEASAVDGGLLQDLAVTPAGRDLAACRSSRNATVTTGSRPTFTRRRDRAGGQAVDAHLAEASTAGRPRWEPR